jgi:hypothetical protein
MDLGFQALTTLMHYVSPGDIKQKRGYFNCTAVDHVGLGSSTSMEFPAAVPPPPGTWMHGVASASCYAACLLSRNRHSEKWWVGGVILGMLYFSTFKFHYHGNSAQAHAAGFWIGSVGLLGTGARIVCGSGSLFINTYSTLGFMALLYTDWGRCHMWTNYIAQFKREHYHAGRVISGSLLHEYLPTDRQGDIEFSYFTRPKEFEGSAVRE